MKTSTCIWFVEATGVCGPDISIAGSQVLCSPMGCKEFQTRMTQEKYKDIDKEFEAVEG